VIVLLSAADYAVALASKLPRSSVESSALYRPHVNGKVLFARPEIMGHPDATDLTATLRTAQAGLAVPDEDQPIAGKRQAEAGLRVSGSRPLAPA
jgi:hypothetical protein